MPSPSTPVSIDDAVRRYVARHLAEDTSIELGGLLAGRVTEAEITVVAAVPARSAMGTARSFVFTEEAWAEVRSDLERLHPDLALVGWYHSHPGLGIHLSNHDLYTCTNFFPEPWQVAYVVDPVHDEYGIYTHTGSELVMSQQVTHPQKKPLISRRQQIIAGGIAVIALALFLLGYFAHSSNPGSQVTFTENFNGVVMSSTVTEHGTNVTLTEKFVNTNKQETKGTITSCLPNGAVVDSFSHLQIVAPDGCVLDLQAGRSASITGKGPAATVLSSIGPNGFQAGN